MRAEALVVERSKAERVRRALAEGGWLRNDLRPVREEAAVRFPVSGLPSPLPPGIEGTRSEGDFPTSGERRPQDYRELVDLPSELRAQLPSSFDIVGDLVLVRLPDPLLPHRLAVGEALLRFVPGCRKVGLDRGVEGVARLRSLEAIAGSGTWATVHRENGIALRVDLERAYFSPRLAREHDRVGRLVGPGERLLDIFCGIGPFSLMVLRLQPSATAVAVDSNPSAIELLRENARALGVAPRVEAYGATAEDFLRGEATFSRAVMNLPREGYKYVTSVARHVMPGGTLHHYEVVPRDLVTARGDELLGEVTHGTGGRWKLAPSHVVHAFSPSSDLIAWTLRREPEA